MALYVQLVRFQLSSNLILHIEGDDASSRFFRRADWRLDELQQLRGFWRVLRIVRNMVIGSIFDDPNKINGGV